jgi:hypothetical protein
MIIIPFLLYHAGLLIGKICITFSFGVIFAVIGAALLHITRISVDILHNFCILIKKNMSVFLFILYLILCIDIVYLILCQVQKELVNDYGYHM